MTPRVGENTELVSNVMPAEPGRIHPVGRTAMRKALDMIVDNLMEPEDIQEFNKSARKVMELRRELWQAEHVLRDNAAFVLEKLMRRR